MNDLHIDLREVLAQASRLQRADFAPLLLDAMDAALLLVEEQVTARTPVNTGLLRGSIAHETYGRPPDFVGVVSTPSIYGEAVEVGRRPGQLPNVGRLAYWVARKGIAQGEQAERVAWAIAKRIAQSGVRGAQMFKDGLQASTPGVIAAFEAAVERIAREVADV